MMKYEIFNMKGDLLTIGEVVLVFINRITNKPCYVPEKIIDKFKQKWIN